MTLQAKDKIFLSIGGLALVLTTVWAFLEQSKISALSSDVTAPTSGPAYEQKEISVAMPPSQTWSSAVPQPAGENWVYNVFTPPKIYYNVKSKQFTVVLPKPEPPEDPVKQEIQPIPAGPDLTLVKVTQPLFRLQLIGYIGDEGNYRGTFSNELTGKTFFGVSGRKLPDLNLEIVTFEAKRRKVAVPGGSTIIDVVSYAIVRDTITGKEYRLEPDKRLPDGPLTATLKLADASEKNVKTGDTLTIGEFSYLIGAVTAEPPSVAVKKSGASLTVPTEETLTIPPPPAPTPVAPPAGSEFAPPPGEPAAPAITF